MKFIDFLRSESRNSNGTARHVKAAVLAALAISGLQAPTVIAQTSLPPIVVNPGGGGAGWPSGGGGFGGGWGTEYCDECQNFGTVSAALSVDHVASHHQSVCNGDQESRFHSANEDVRQHQISHGGIFSGLTPGLIVEVSYSDGGSEQWIVDNPTFSIIIGPAPVPGSHFCP